CSSLAYRALHVAVGHGHGLCSAFRVVVPQSFDQRHQRGPVEVRILCTAQVGADQPVNLVFVARSENDDPLVSVRGELAVGNAANAQPFFVGACSVADGGTDDVRGGTGDNQLI